MTNKNYESISALLDDEIQNDELDTTLQQLDDQPEQVGKFSRYGLIGDVLRQEQVLVTNNDFASGIQEALEHVEQDTTDKTQESVVSIASHPSWGQRVIGRVKSYTASSAGRNVSQFAIAASVALVAVFGVNNITPEQEINTSPVVSTSPLPFVTNSISPVSLSAEQPSAKPSANQMTQSRINALISDHQQQLRVVDDKTEKEKELEDNKVID